MIDAADTLANQSLRVAHCFDILSEWPLLPRRFAWVSGEGPAGKALTALDFRRDCEISKRFQ